MKPADFAFVFGAVAFMYASYFLGLQRGRQQPADVGRVRFSLRGLVWSVTIPLSFLVMYLSLAAHLRLTLGRWPLSIGDNPDSWWLHLHSQATWWYAVGIAYSLMLLPAAFLACLVVRRWLSMAAYLSCYVVAVLMGFGLMHAVPEAFVMWFWD